jgi:hypothetical protein
VDADVLKARTSHSLIALSSAPDATVVPSGENATEWAAEVWPVRLCKRPPVATFHRLIVLSYDPDASVVPPGENATE